MNGLLEFMTRVKGIEYLLALGFLFSFVAFWQWHQYRGNRLALRMAPLLVVALIFGVLATLVITSPATAKKDQQFPSVDQAHYLANIYGPAKFAAHGMSPDIISCQTCHHHSTTGQPQACSDCHKDPFDGQSTGQVTDKPGLKAAYHQRCADCHTEAFSGPLTCTNCHTEKPESAVFAMKSPAPATAPDISHGLLAQYSNCFSCHAPEGLLPLPGNHKNYKANVECLGCHKPSVSTPGVTIQTVKKPEAPSAPAAQPPVAQPPVAAQPAQAAGPAQITHPLAGRDNCTACHQVGGALKPMPADHSNRANGSCQSCHKGA